MRVVFAENLPREKVSLISNTIDISVPTSRPREVKFSAKTMRLERSYNSLAKSSRVRQAYEGSNNTSNY